MTFTLRCEDTQAWMCQIFPTMVENFNEFIKENFRTRKERLLLKFKTSGARRHQDEAIPGVLSKTKSFFSPLYP